MESDTPSESTFFADEGLYGDVDDPYSSLLSMGAPSESTSMPIISVVIFLLKLGLGLEDSHVAKVYIFLSYYHSKIKKDVVK